jgi:hypothetical protein
MSSLQKYMRTNAAFRQNFEEEKTLRHTNATTNISGTVNPHPMIPLAALAARPPPSHQQTQHLIEEYDIFRNLSSF